MSGQSSSSESKLIAFILSTKWSSRMFFLAQLTPLDPDVMILRLGLWRSWERA
jgi:hypothetical protein